MAFIDLNSKNADFVIPPSDVTIIGAGAAGILLAIKLSREGKSVVVFESGHFTEDMNKQQLNNVHQIGKKLKNAVWGRKRAIGGTTIAWGGQSLPFTSMDFEERDWIQNSGWPVSYKDLQPYYSEANSFMGIDTLNYTTDIFEKISLSNPGIDATVFDFHLSKWAKQPNFFESHKDELNKSVTIFYNAQVVSIDKVSEHISSISISNFNKIHLTSTVQTLIVAAGTIETVRLLLNNKLGYDSAWLGKGFMEHPCIEVGTICTKNLYRLQKNFNTHILKGCKFSIRLSLNSKFQQENKLLNCSASIMFQYDRERFDPYQELKALKKDLKLKRVIKLSGSAKSILQSTYAYIFDKFFYKPNSTAKLALMIEQEPVKESNISLSIDKDEFHVSQPIIKWNITAKTWSTAVTTSILLKKELEKLDLGTVKLYEYIKEDTSNWSDYLSDVCHHMGGARMSSSLQNGVVNKNLQVWGLSNLYVCSCAVFPTSSHSNPTLTLMALACRLCDFLTKKIKV